MNRKLSTADIELLSYSRWVISSTLPSRATDISCHVANFCHSGDRFCYQCFDAWIDWGLLLHKGKRFTCTINSNCGTMSSLRYCQIVARVKQMCALFGHMMWSKATNIQNNLLRRSIESYIKSQIGNVNRLSNHGNNKHSSFSFLKPTFRNRYCYYHLPRIQCEDAWDDWKVVNWLFVVHKWMLSGRITT